MKMTSGWAASASTASSASKARTKRYTGCEDRTCPPREASLSRSERVTVAVMSTTTLPAGLTSMPVSSVGTSEVMGSPRLCFAS